MIDFSEFDLKIVFNYSECNNKFMQVEVNDQLLVPVENYATYEKKFKLPTQISIKTYGKTKYDTKVDSGGNIYQDLAVIIESISLDSFKLNEVYLNQKINIITDSGHTVTTNYIGYNGTITLDFNEDTVFAQVLTSNN